MKSKWSYILFLIFAITLIFPLSAQAQTADEEGIPNWPRVMKHPEAEVIVYQPQLEAFKGNNLEARAAVSITPKGKTEPVFGAVWVKARVAIDYTTRMVALEKVTVTAVKFPESNDAAEKKLVTFLERAIPIWDLSFSLDRLLAGMELVEQTREVDRGLKHDPPKIIFVTEPSVLVLIDGKPQLRKVENTSLQYVVNTPYFIVLDPKMKRYYLKGGEYWFAALEVKGPWAQTSAVPSQVAKLARKMEEEARKQKQEIEKEVGDEAKGTQTDKKVVPKVIISTEPAELIQTNGKPELAPLQGTNLLYVKNTDADILMDIKSQKYFLLVSGRWYTSGSLSDGKWAHVQPEKVPADFGKIPENSDMGTVLSSVAGTQQAKEAVLENSIPKTAEVDRKSAKLTVKYDGTPEFKAVEDTRISYAVNTASAVFRIDNRFYCCDDAVWYEASGASGPWAVCVKVPVEIQKLPPSNPHYNVKYVQVYEATPTVVYVGYTPGYTGSYYYHGSVVYGTGWYYNPWYRHYYYPRPVTYGFGVHWNPWTGWGFYAGFGFGWFRVGWGVGFGPWWGPMPYRYGYRAGFYHGYWAGRHMARYRYSYGRRPPVASPYHRRGYRSVYHRPRAGVKPPRVPGRPTPYGGRKATPARRPANNVYTDKRGNVYRKQGNQWQQRSNKTWSSKKQPTTRQRQSMNRQAKSRQRGTTRTQSYNRSRSTQRSRSSSAGRRRR